MSEKKPAFEIDEEFRTLLGDLEVEELQLLEASIAAEGCRDPLVTWRGVLVDGHHRFGICSRLGIDFHVVELDRAKSRDTVLLWILDHQNGRRNLSPYARGELALKRLAIEGRLAKERMAEAGAKAAPGRPAEKGVEMFPPLSTDDEDEDEDPEPEPTPVEPVKRKPAPKSRDRAAKKAGISGRQLDKVRVINEKASNETKEKLRKGETTVNKEYNAITQPERRAAKEAEIIEQSEAGEIEGRFAVIYADPPWRYDYSKSRSRDIENQYPTMSLDELRALKVNEIAVDDAVLYLWATPPKLEEALQVVRAWGFEFKTCMVWVKDKIGMGYWARQRHELLLIATQGSPLLPDSDVRPDSVVEAPRQAHSAKPDAVREIIERCFPNLPKIELFARSEREGWNRWGHEA